MLCYVMSSYGMYYNNMMNVFLFLLSCHLSIDRSIICLICLRAILFFINVITNVITIMDTLVPIKYEIFCLLDQNFVLVFVVGKKCMLQFSTKFLILFSL